MQVSSARTSAMRKPKAPEANRVRILAAAVAEFASRGFKGASMDAIAARTSTTRALINYYFGSKEKLYLAVLEHVYAEIRHPEPVDVGIDDAEPDVAAAMALEEHFFAGDTFERALSKEHR